MSPEGVTPHRFGGEWTTKKLEVLAQYLHAYTTALQGRPTADSPFRKAYIDGFAGTGTRAAPEPIIGGDQEELVLDAVDVELESGLLEGSARIALATQPAFDRYVFIEKSPTRCNQLEGLKEEFPELSRRIWIVNSEANSAIRELCSGNWSAHRAVMFLDPYGLQVEWATLEAIASTRAIDLWLLFPLWMGVNRVVTKSGEMQPGWRRRLTLLLGDESWEQEFYHVEQQGNLFGDTDRMVKKVSTEVIGHRFVERLKRIFPGVAESPGILRNSRNSPIYLLCFAAANEKGSRIALRIANHLLRDLH